MGTISEDREGGRTMSEEQQQHPQEPAEGGEKDVQASGVEKVTGGNGGAEDAGDAAWPSQHPQEPAEGGEEDVEAPGAERVGDDG
jgi:hypothetical protein